MLTIHIVSCGRQGPYHVRVALRAKLHLSYDALLLAGLREDAPPGIWFICVLYRACQARTRQSSATPLKQHTQVMRSCACTASSRQLSMRCKADTSLRLQRLFACLTCSKATSMGAATAQACDHKLPATLQITLL